MLPPPPYTWLITIPFETALVDRIKGNGCNKAIAGRQATATTASSKRRINFLLGLEFRIRRTIAVILESDSGASVSGEDC